MVLSRRFIHSEPGYYRFAGFFLVFLILTFLTGLTTPLYAEEKSMADLHTFQVFFENDLFGETDKYYTNAVQITWLSNDLKRYKDDVRLPDELIEVLKLIPFAEEPGSTHNIGILLGQHIYTPSDIQDTALRENDRPYAGFLYTGFALHSKTDEILDTAEIVLGIIGSEAKGEFAQNTVHDLRDIPTAKGWHNQLHTEPGLRLSWQRKWRYYEDKLFDFFDYDFIPYTGLTLGNVRTAVHAGGEFRIGYNIPKDFGSDVIRAGAGVSTPALSKTPEGKRSFGFHLFTSGQLELVGHDIFLDGNTFRNSPGVEKEKAVIDISGGLALIYDNYKVTYRHLYRTKQFKSQKKNHIIGSITLTLSF